MRQRSSVWWGTSHLKKTHPIPSLGGMQRSSRTQADTGIHKDFINHFWIGSTTYWMLTYYMRDLWDGGWSSKGIKEFGITKHWPCHFITHVRLWFHKCFSHTDWVWTMFTWVISFNSVLYTSGPQHVLHQRTVFQNFSTDRVEGRLAVMRAMRRTEEQQMKLHALVLPLTFCCAAWFLTGHGPGPVHSSRVGDACSML